MEVSILGIHHSGETTHSPKAVGTNYAAVREEQEEEEEVSSMHSIQHQHSTAQHSTAQYIAYKPINVSPAVREEAVHLTQFTVSGVGVGERKGVSPCCKRL